MATFMDLWYSVMNKDDSRADCRTCRHYLAIDDTHSFGCTAITSVDDKVQFNEDCKYFERGIHSALNPILSAEELQRRCDFGEPKSEILKSWLEFLESGLGDDVK